MHIIALSLTTLLTFTFPAGIPTGTPFIVETPASSYPCSILASKCIVSVLNTDLQFAQAACIRPAGAQIPRNCFYFTQLSVAAPKISKRRLVKGR